MEKPILFIIPSKMMMRNYMRSQVWAKKLKALFEDKFKVAFIPDKMEAYTEVSSITKIMFKDDNVELSTTCPKDKDSIDSLICGLKYLLDNAEQFKMEIEKEENSDDISSE